MKKEKRQDPLPGRSICAYERVKTLIPGHMTGQKIKPTSELEPEPSPAPHGQLPVSSLTSPDFPSPPAPPNTDSAFNGGSYFSAALCVCFMVGRILLFHPISCGAPRRPVGDWGGAQRDGAALRHSNIRSATAALKLKTACKRVGCGWPAERRGRGSTGSGAAGGFCREMDARPRLTYSR